jgi:hypothetical protein
MIVGDQHRVQLADTGGQELLAHVRRGIDQHTRFALGPAPCHQNGTAQPPVFGIGGIAGAPIGAALAQARHAPG